MVVPSLTYFQLLLEFVSAVATRLEEVGKPCVELTFDAMGREFEEQVRMPDCIENMRYVQKDGPDVISNIESLHPLLCESKIK